MTKLLPLILLSSPLILPMYCFAGTKSADTPIREDMQWFVSIARDHYDEHVHVLGGGDYGIDYQWLASDDIAFPCGHKALALSTAKDIQAAVKRCLFPDQIPMGKGRDHKRLQDLQRHTSHFTSELEASWNLYDYYLLENWETSSDNGGFAECGIGITPKGQPSHHLMMGLQAVKI